MGNRGASGTGGAGAGYHTVVYISETGTYNITVGSGGISRGADRNANSENTTDGTATIMNKNSTDFIVAGGGTAGKGYQYSASAGSGGTLSVSNLTEQTVHVKTNGKNGTTAGKGATAAGAAGPITGHTWGASGNASGSAGGGNASASYNGYFMIKYVGTG